MGTSKINGYNLNFAKFLLTVFVINLIIFILNISASPVELGSIEENDNKVYYQSNFGPQSEYTDFTNIYKNFRVRRDTKTDHETEKNSNDKEDAHNGTVKTSNVMKIIPKKHEESTQSIKTDVVTKESEIFSIPTAISAGDYFHDLKTLHSGEMVIITAAEKELSKPYDKNENHDKHYESPESSVNETTELKLSKKIVTPSCVYHKSTGNTKINPNFIDKNHSSKNHDEPHSINDQENRKQKCGDDSKTLNESNKNDITNYHHTPIEILNDIISNYNKTDVNKTDIGSLKNDSEYRLELRLYHIHDQIKRIIADIQEHMIKENKEDTKNITEMNNSLNYIRTIVAASIGIEDETNETNSTTIKNSATTTEEAYTNININDPKYRIVVDEEEYQNTTKNDTSHEDTEQKNTTSYKNDEMYRIAVDEEEYIKTNRTEEMQNNSTNKGDDENLSRISIHINPTINENTTSTPHHIKKRDESTSKWKKQDAAAVTVKVPNINDLDHRIAVDEEEYIATVEEAPKVANDNINRPVFKLPRFPIKNNLQHIALTNQNFSRTFKEIKYVPAAPNYNSNARVSRILNGNKTDIKSITAMYSTTASTRLLQNNSFNFQTSDTSQLNKTVVDLNFKSKFNDKKIIERNNDIITSNKYSTQSVKSQKYKKNENISHPRQKRQLVDLRFYIDIGKVLVHVNTGTQSRCTYNSLNELYDNIRNFTTKRNNRNRKNRRDDDDDDDEYFDSEYEGNKNRNRRQINNRRQASGNRNRNPYNRSRNINARNRNRNRTNINTINRRNNTNDYNISATESNRNQRRNNISRRNRSDSNDSDCICNCSGFRWRSRQMFDLNGRSDNENEEDYNSKTTENFVIKNANNTNNGVPMIENMNTTSKINSTNIQMKMPDDSNKNENDNFRENVKTNTDETNNTKMSTVVNKNDNIDNNNDEKINKPIVKETVETLIFKSGNIPAE